MEIEKFLKRIDVLLAERGWSKKTLAQKTKIKLNTMHGFWTKQRIPRGDDLVNIASALNTTAEYLITGKNPPYTPQDPIFREIISILDRFTRDELIEIRGVIRSYMMHYFRQNPPEQRSVAAEKED